MRVAPYYVNSLSIGFQDWSTYRDGTDYLNFNLFKVDSNLSPVNGTFLQKETATIRDSLIDGSNNVTYSIDFSDPWLVDSTDQRYKDNTYGYHNLGGAAFFRTETSPLNLSLSSKYKGVLENQAASSGAYYCGRASSVTSIASYLAFFAGWAATGATYFDGGPKSNGYDSAAIVFSSPNALVTAKYSYYTVAVNAFIPSGTWLMAGTVAVASGVTLNISSGAVLKFPASTGLVVNGALSASGATFTSTSGTWNGITLNASNSSLTGCTISSASNGVTFASASSGTMNECTVQNCNYGVLIQGGSAPNITSITSQNNSSGGIEVLNNGTGVPTIYASSASHNYYGIYVYNSTSLIQENSITNNTYAGVYCYDYGSPTSGAVGQEGGNTISSNYCGILARYSSLPDFGGSIPSKGEYWGVCNNIYNNSIYDADAQSSSGITAEWDFWNSIPPPKIYYASGCYVDDSYAEEDQSDCPLGGGDAPAISAKARSATPNISTGSPILSAIEAQMTGNYSLAISDYTKILADMTLKPYHHEALARLYNVFQISRDSTVLETLSRVKLSNANLKHDAEELLASSEAALGHLDIASSLAQDLKATYPDSQSQIDALILLVSLRGFNQSYSAVSKTAFAELAQKYASSMDRGLLLSLRTEGDVPLPSAASPSIDSSSASADSTGSSLANYPNPFNPSTQIRFTVRQTGLVSLKIYDILGREVATLVSGVKTTGTYNVNWNANDLATGVYFARFEAGGKIAIKKLMYLK